MGWRGHPHRPPAGNAVRWRTMVGKMTTVVGADKSFGVVFLNPAVDTKSASGDWTAW